MATQGVLWTPTKQDLRDALKKHNGVLSRAAKELGVRRYTLHYKLKEHPDLMQLMQELRNDMSHQFLDMAENAIIYAMANQKEDPGNALKAAMFVLNSRGKEREWNDTYGEGSEKTELNESFIAIMNQISKNQSANQSLALKNDEITIINDNKS